MADQKQELDQIIKSIEFPVALPEAAFLLFGKQRRVPDFDLIISQLPQALREHLDPNATASSGGHSTYLLPLVDGRFLRLKIEDHTIVEVAAVDH
jgi:hypothetical protein